MARALQKLGKEYLGFELKVTAFTDLLQGHLTTKVDMLQLYQPRDEEEYGKASAWKVRMHCRDLHAICSQS